GEGITGIGLGGVALGAGGKLKGLMASGVAMGSGEGISGIALSGVALGAGGRLTGIMASGFAVGSGKGITGLALSGGVVGSGGELKGIAIGGLGVSLEEVTGLVVGGINGIVVDHLSFSIHNERFHGLSIGVLNFTRRLHGVQIGLINYARNNPKYLRVVPFINVHR
ncbi:MAG: hypothetical protein HY710_11275, partial [Candidatus Latescibacteria bacterium]|nr:hypothetical protein [Candidatus Latescibacterota bacterium]